MGSCRKRNALDRILNGDCTSSRVKLVSYANWLNGVKTAYDEGKLQLSEQKYKLLKRAYEHAMTRLSGGGIGLDYIPPAKPLRGEGRKRERKIYNERVIKH